MPKDVSITVVGSLTNDIEVKYLAGGDAVVNFGVAVNTRKKEGDEWVDGPAHFYNCVAWRSLAENLASIAKGTRLIVTGTLDHEQWEKDGVKHSAHKIQAEAIGPDLRWATAQVTKTTGSGASSPLASRPVPEANPFA